MNSSYLSLINYLYLFTISVLLVLSVITTFNRRSSNQNAGILLALFNWIFYYAAFVGYLVFSNNIVLLPHLFRTANICMLLYFPLSYLYIVQSFSPRSFRYRDLLHLLPALIFIIDFFPFFMKSGAEKIVIFNSLSSRGQIGGFKEGLFMPPYFHIAIRYILMAGYWIAQVHFMKKVLAANGDLLRRNNPIQVRWIKWLIASELIIFVPTLPFLATGSFEIVRVFIQAWALVAASIQGYFLFSHPEILYGIKGIIIDQSTEIPLATDFQLPEGTNQVINESTKKESVQYLSESMLDKIQQSLDSYMQEKKPFLQPGFGLFDLAAATSFTPHQVSAFINKRCEMNFYSYINKHRVEYCKQKFYSKEYVDKTLEAISQESGFQSRATFIRAFKSQTGATPSEYIKGLKDIERGNHK